MADVLFGVGVASKRTEGPARIVSGVSLSGVDSLKAVLSALGTAAPKALAGALFREANLIVTDAKKLTPVETGALRASGHVQLPDINGNQVSLTLGFGGSAGVGNVGETNSEDVGYAVIVHEDLSKSHPVGQAKYLESALLDHANGMESRLEADLKGTARVSR